MSEPGRKVHRIGVIGTGSRGRTLMECIQFDRAGGHLSTAARQLKGLRVPVRGRAEIVAAADPDAGSCERAVAMLDDSVPVHDDPQRVIDNPDVELVFVATASIAHARWCVAAMAAGKDVVSEKPMATTLEDCDRIVDAVRRTKRFFGLSMQNRYSYWCRTVTDLIRSGELGDVKMMWCHEFRGPLLRKVDNWYHYMETSGGPFLEKNSHHWDIFNWWMQAPAKSVYAKTHNTGAHQGDIWDMAMAMVEYENGVLANHTLSLATRFSHNLEMGVIGTDGWAKSERTPDGGTVTYHDNTSPQEMTFRANTPPLLRIGHVGAELPMLDHMFDCLESGIEPETNCYWGRESIMVGLAAQRSADEGRPVAVDEIRKESRFPDVMPRYGPQPFGPRN